MQNDDRSTDTASLMIDLWKGLVMPAVLRMVLECYASIDEKMMEEQSDDHP